MKLDTDSLAHTQWNCKYHIMFAPKYRRQAIYGKIKSDMGKMLRKPVHIKGENNGGRKADIYYAHMRQNTAKDESI